MTEEKQPIEKQPTEETQSIGKLAFFLFGLPLIVIILAAVLGWI